MVRKKKINCAIFVLQCYFFIACIPSSHFGLSTCCSCAPCNINMHKWSWQHRVPWEAEGTERLSFKRLSFANQGLSECYLCNCWFNSDFCFNIFSVMVLIKTFTHLVVSTYQDFHFHIFPFSCDEPFLNHIFMIAAKVLACSLANSYCQ